MNNLYYEVGKMPLLLAGALLLTGSLIGGCSSSDAEKVADIIGVTVDINGTVTENGGVPLSGVTVSARLVGADTEAEDEATTGANGTYTVTVIENAMMYIEFSKAGYATINTQISELDADVTGLDMELPTTADAQAIIDAAFGGMGFTLAAKGWLAIDVRDGGDNEVNGATVNVSASPDGGGATNCDGTLTGTNVTSAPPCSPGRDGTMYLAYYNANSNVTITVGSQSIQAPVRMGEVTYVLVETP